MSWYNQWNRLNQWYQIWSVKTGSTNINTVQRIQLSRNSAILVKSKLHKRQTEEPFILPLVLIVSHPQSSIAQILMRVVSWGKSSPTQLFKSFCTDDGISRQTDDDDLISDEISWIKPAEQFLKVLDLQTQTDEKAVIGRLHQQVMLLMYHIY